MSRRSSSRTEFSFNWAILSLFGYLFIQVVFGIFANIFVYRHVRSNHTELLAEGLIIIFGFYIGAFVVGVISPGRRLIEPVLGAVMAVAAVFSVSTFTPQMGGWYRIDGLGAMLTAAFLAATVAALGAYSGEKLMGNAGK